jgi:hypothetical protein
VLACCDVFGNVDGDYLGMDDPTGQNGNISADPYFCDAESGIFTLAQYSPCLPEHNDCGVLIGAYGEGCEGELTDAAGAAPAAFLLHQNVPNPFNPATEIRFDLPAPAAVTLRIYDVAGRRVSTLLDGAALPAGELRAFWRGEDDAGAPMPSGIYFCQLETGAEIATRKMTLLR